MASAVVRARVTSPWFVRLAVQILIFVVGGVLFVMGKADPDTVDGWSAQAGPFIAMLSSALAAVNIGPDSDGKVEVKVAPVVPETVPEEVAAGGSTVVEVVPSGAVDSGLPVYTGSRSDID